MIKAVIFDLDGVLVDAVEWHYIALNKSLSLFGFAIDAQEHSEIYNGLPTSTKLEMMSRLRGLPKSLHPFINEMKQLYTQQILSTYCGPEMRVSGMLRHLRAQGFSIGLASNSTRPTVDKVLERMAIRDYFDVVLSRDDVKEAKPSAEIFETCFKLMRVKPNQCLIVEDSNPGVEAAEKTEAHVMTVTGPKDVTLERVINEISSFSGVKTSQALQRNRNAGENVQEIEIVIPMAGLGQRFSAVGYKNPKPLIDVLGKPMIQWVVENIRPSKYKAHFTFICNQEHLNNLGVEKLLQSIAPGCSIIATQGVTEGAACTVLLAAEHLNHSRPLIIANSDQWVEMDIDAFIDAAMKNQCDGSIMTFEANEKKWSYAKVDSTGRVTEVAEKKPISTHATVGIYYFKNAKDFLTGAQEMIRKNIRTNGEFYVCPVYNELVTKQHDIRLYPLSPGAMHGLGTPEDLETFLSWKEAA